MRIRKESFSGGVYKGFPTSMAQDERTKLIDKFLVGFQNLQTNQNIGLILKGSRNNRQATNISYVEFYSTDDFSTVLETTKDFFSMWVMSASVQNEFLQKLTDLEIGRSGRHRK